MAIPESRQREAELPAEFGMRREQRKKTVERKEEAVDQQSLRRLQVHLPSRGKVGSFMRDRCGGCWCTYRALRHA